MGPISEEIAFLNQTVNTVNKDVVFSRGEWMDFVNAVNVATWQALIYGLVIGFVVGAMGVYLGIWWNGRQG